MPTDTLAVDTAVVGIVADVAPPGAGRAQAIAESAPSAPTMSRTCMSRHIMESMTKDPCDLVALIVRDCVASAETINDCGSITEKVVVTT